MKLVKRKVYSSEKVCLVKENGIVLRKRETVLENEIKFCERESREMPGMTRSRGKRGECGSKNEHAAEEKGKIDNEVEKKRKQ